MCMEWESGWVECEKCVWSWGEVGEAGEIIGNGERER